MTGGLPARPSVTARERRRAMLRAFAYPAARELLIVCVVSAFHSITDHSWRGIRARRRVVPR